MNVTVLFRRGTAATAAANNVVLDDGEGGYEKDTRRLKIGDGVTPWNNLPYLAGGGDTDGPWGDYTPTVVPSSGSFGTAPTVRGRFKKLGKTVHVRINILISNNGSASGYLIVSLPAPTVSLGNPAYQQPLTGKEYGAIGFGVEGNLADGGTTMNVTKAEGGGYPGGNNFIVTIGGTYEAA
jgi:hypothetical protein